MVNTSLLDVIGFGSICVDFVFKVGRYPRRGTTNLSIAAAIGCGGIVGNFLVACSKLGLRCGVIGIIGMDCYGKMIVDCFSKHGIDTSMLVIDPKGSSAKVVCIVDRKGERTFIVDPGVQARVKMPEKAREYVSKCKVFHTDCLDVRLASILLREAKQSNVMTSVDIGALAEHAFQRVKNTWINDVLMFCDVAFISEDNARRMFPGLSDAEVLKSVLARGVKIAVMTLGERGCIVASSEGLIEVSAFKVNAVDTTGAGDAFEAGFIYAMLEGLDIRSAAIFGSAVAAIKCTKLGAQAGLPTLDEVKRFLIRRGYGPLASSVG
ncbi:MAG: carbohydrate kinase family protein [Candidatus Nezhaarchaeota archaeon]|nr:carbohydrate kinase family protein [Candidatus Nezhaarchaeota archaeon]